MLQLDDSMRTSHLFSWVPSAASKIYKSQHDHEGAVNLKFVAAEILRKNENYVPRQYLPDSRVFVLAVTAGALKVRSAVL